MTRAINIYGPPQAREHVWDRHRVNLFINESNPGSAGNRTIRTTNSFSTIYIERCERLCHVWAGIGKQFDLGEFYYGVRKSINIPTAVNELFIEWEDAALNENIVPMPFGVTSGSTQFSLPIIDLWTSSTVVYFEESYDPRSVLTATRDFTVWDPSYTIGDPGSSKALLSTSYAFVCRRNTRPYRISVAHLGNDRKLLATFWRPADLPGFSRIVRLRRIEIQPYEFTGVGDVVFDLVPINTEPTGGIAVVAENMVTAIVNPKTECRVAPSAGGAESGFPISSVAVRSSAAFFDSRGWISLYDDTFTDAMHPPQLTRDVVSGWAVVSDSDVAQSVRCFVRAWFTEQNGNLGIGG